MQLHKQKKQKNLTAVGNTNAKIIVMNAKHGSTSVQGKRDYPLLPPLDQFNTGYIKAKHNDPL